MGDIDITNFKTSHVSSLPKLNGDEIAEVLQSEAGFTISTDKKPIVATYGCGPCVALGGYDATNGIAFVVHFSTANEVRKCGGMIFYNISKLAKKKMESPIQLHIRGGVEGKSEETINAIKTWMKQREDLPMEIASEDVLGSRMCNDAKSISIDSRNGTVSDYNPRANLKSRGMSDLEAMSAIMSGFMPNIKIAYTPK
jgi:chemotaxis receptor (MCP) glutamine deamidase CheD